VTVAHRQPTNDPRVSRRHYILGTAGHIDHGKSSLVKALTGTDPDRLPEERRRGMTIELGFAELDIDDIRFGVVDVPGHERFVRTMVAGATGIDVALLVVAADDAVMPQTIEHVDILKLLGVRQGVVAISKIDLVDEELVELVTEDVRRLLDKTPLAEAPICPVSSVEGTGLDSLRAALVAAARAAHPSPVSGPFRMAVDRVFTVQGRGTVLTGSSLRGSVAVGDALEVWPGGETCRVRDLQTHGAHEGRLERGQRCALNVTGVDRERLERGVELATPGYLQPSRLLDVRIECLVGSGKPLKSTSVVRLELGTSEAPARVVLLDRKALDPGDSAFAQLRLGTPITSVFGQRFIVRDENAARTIGGGMVLRPASRRRRRDVVDELDALARLETGTAIDRVEQVLRQSGFEEPKTLRLCGLAGVEPEELDALFAELDAAARRVPVDGTDIRVVPAAVSELGDRLSVWLERHHRKNPDRPGRPAESVIGWIERLTSRPLAKPLFDLFLTEGRIKRIGAFIGLPAFAPTLSTADERLMATLIDEIRRGGFQPPSLDAIPGVPAGDRKRVVKLATLAVALGELVNVDGTIFLHIDAEAELRRRVVSLVEQHGGVTVSQVREALDSSRKFVVPFLEWLDRAGFTRRDGDQRVLAG